MHEDLQPASYLMLSWLADEGPVRASSMVDNFGIDKGAVSRQLQHLVDLGLVERTPGPRGRPGHPGRGQRGRRPPPRPTSPTHRRKWLDEQLGDWGAERAVAQFVGRLERYNLSLNA